jgi:hypothetical protein
MPQKLQMLVRRPRPLVAPRFALIHYTSAGTSPGSVKE